MELLLIPLVLFIAGIIFYVNLKKAKKQFNNINAVERSSAAVVIENHEHFLIEFGKGTYQQYVELNGIVKAQNPLEAPISGRPCVYAEHRVTRKYDIQVQQRDAQGRMETRYESRTETISGNKQSIPFILVDENNEISILPDAAEIFPVQSHNSQPAGIDNNLAGKLGISTFYGTGRTTGFSIIENIIPVGQQLYVLGEANDRSGNLAVSKPRDKEQSFILSATQEDVLLQKLATKVTWLRIGFWASLIIGFISLAYILYTIIYKTPVT